MPSPLDMPSRPAWKDEIVNMAGILIRPSTYNDSDRALIDQRLSKHHDEKGNNDEHDDTSA